MNIPTLIFGIAVGILIVLVLPLIKKLIGALYVPVIASYIMCAHFLRTGRSLRKDLERDRQKNIDDTYEKMGFPRGTFTEWQLSDGKQGIAQFRSKLNGFYDRLEFMPTDNRMVMIVWDHKISEGYWVKDYGWTAIYNGQEKCFVPVTHWKFKEDK